MKILTALLAQTGGRVVIPDAVEVVPGSTPDEVNFVDANGVILVIFKRADLSVYANDGILTAQADGAEPPGPEPALGPQWRLALRGQARPAASRR